MYAVVRTGGKQYRVSVNDVIRVETVKGDVGSFVELDEVLFFARDEIRKTGTPLVLNASVKAEILSQEKDDRVLVFKKQRRQNYRRKRGHRQNITVLRITDLKES